MSACRALLLYVGALIAISGPFAPCQTCSVQLSTPGPVAAASPGKMPAYEVATIKPWDGQGFATPLRVYIQRAFGMPPNVVDRVIGPDWVNSMRYVIQAKPPEPIRDAMQTMSAAERGQEDSLMRQSLLADRFQLKAHFETREMSVYELVLAKGGSKLKEDADETKRRIAVGGSSIRGSAIPIHALIDALECAADIGGREVVDKTGLSGTYDLSLTWAPLQAAATSGGGTAPASDEGASLFTALEEQLGLKLVCAKEPGKVLVIDHIERPSGN